MKKKLPWFLFPFLSLPMLLGAQPGQISIPRIELMPNLPQPIEIRDWKKIALDYDRLVFNPNAQGQYLPLIAFAPAGQFNYPDNEALLLDTYVGSKYHLNQAEAINIMPAIVGATLAGVDKSNQTGINYVKKLKDFYNLKNGQNLYLNNYFGVTGNDWWYEVMPNVFFLQIKKLYPQCYPEAEDHMYAIANRWALCIKSLGGSETPWTAPQMNYRAFNFQTLKPLTTGVPEPEAAGAIAWILFHIYEQSGNKGYRIAAEQAMDFLNQLTTNPSYELQLAYGVAAAARMNAVLGTDYNLEKMLGWCFTKGPLRGWGSIIGSWGGYDVSGLIGEVSDDVNTGYAFSMNGFQQAGALAPVPKYDKRFARSIAKWLFNLINASRLFYPNSLPPQQQDSYNWSSQYDNQACIPYEALKAPWQGWPVFARGDALEGGWANTNLSLYSGSSVGYLAAIIHSVNQQFLLTFNLNATDWFDNTDLPAFLCYNPFSEPKTIQFILPAGYDKVYEAITESHMSPSSGDTLFLTLPPDEARIIRFYSSADTIYTIGTRLMANSHVLDYNYKYDFRKPLRIKSLGVKSRTILKGSTFDAWCNIGNAQENVTCSWILNNDTLTSTQMQVLLNAPADTGLYVLSCILKSGEQIVQDTLHLLIVSSLPEIPAIDSITSDKPWYQASTTARFKVWTNTESPEIDWQSPALSFINTIGDECMAMMPATDTALWLKTTVRNKYGISVSDSIAILVKDTMQPQPEPLIWLPFDLSDNNVVNNSLIPHFLATMSTEDPRGIPQYAVRLASASSYLMFLPSSELSFSEPLTISIWMFPETTGYEQYIVSHGSWQERFKLSLLPDKKLRFTVNTSAGVKDLDTRQPVALDFYTHATALYTGYSLEIYLNGNLDNFLPFKGKLKATEKSLLLGRMFENSDEYSYRGKLDEFRLYNGLLQPNHIKRLPVTWYTNPQNTDKLKIFPNPCLKNSMISIVSPDDIKAAELFTTNGLQVPAYFRYISSRHVELTAPSTSGVFLLKILDKTDNSLTSKIVVLPNPLTSP